MVGQMGYFTYLLSGGRTVGLEGEPRGRIFPKKNNLQDQSLGVAG